MGDADGRRVEQLEVAIDRALGRLRGVTEPSPLVRRAVQLLADAAEGATSFDGVIDERDELRSFLETRESATDLLAKFASGGAGRRTGELLRNGWIRPIRVTAAGRRALERRRLGK